MEFSDKTPIWKERQELLLYNINFLDKIHLSSSYHYYCYFFLMLW